ncbi:uncharacterized protein YjbI with pentapeptide repeats [Umezawaea tangerina]|uniref:Uncharacterized protein YjbI with pentapeptide repeats n=1 Tax=Umezawaea tangerina TaxID=84725 RepID=A0A2T0SPH3_9PSEU|nr:uncharacterized protein YjbI with pentapeptide repeats [Umezawaea tangerina]
MRPPLPQWTVPVVAVVVLAVTAVASLLLWNWVNSLQLKQEQRATAVLEVFKLAASVAVGGGGLFALYLAARRQRTQELELAQREKVQAHAERVAEATERDAAERRITELYAKASDQLGSEKAAVRLAGLYALERLGQSTPGQQEAIGNLLCAYLRMPHPKPRELPEDSTAEQLEAHALAQALYDQERETRQTALDILTRHHPEAEQGWTALPILLSRADLIGANLTRANLARADLTDADLTSARLGFADLTYASLGFANLTNAYLIDARLTGANLVRARLIGANLVRADLTGARLAGAHLTRADLTRAYARANLTGANLTGADLVDANLTGANLARADLTHADLTRADLTRAYLVDANLTGADLARADLTHADLTHADLTDADLRGAYLNDAVYDDKTIVTGVIVDENTKGMWW